MHKFIAQLLVLMIRHVSWALNNMIIVSKGWCDTEVWGNDAELSDLITRMNYLWNVLN